ncbi:MAG: Hsp20/alpha crystallin family protein [Novosphingobium sp.]|nr:Hsp20/alpha crystallin family protein [Novosphingobium sp.]
MASFRSLVPFGRSSIDPFASLREEMDRLLEDFGRGLPTTWTTDKPRFLLPKVDAAETDEGLEITAELPGFDEKDVSLDIHDGVLTIKAEHKDEREEKDENKRYHLVERHQGTFLRRFALPFEPDVEKASAQIDKGLLKVMVPRLSTQKQGPRKIEVTSK